MCRLVNAGFFYLQLVGLAHEIHDTHVNEAEAKKTDSDEKVRLKNKYQNVDPTVWEMFLYAYCYIGLLTGKMTG